MSGGISAIIFNVFGSSKLASRDSIAFIEYDLILAKSSAEISPINEIIRAEWIIGNTFPVTS